MDYFDNGEPVAAPAWYVFPLRFLGSFGDFLLNVKIGLDLGHRIDNALKIAWIMRGVR